MFVSDLMPLILAVESLPSALPGNEYAVEDELLVEVAVVALSSLELTGSVVLVAEVGD